MGETADLVEIVALAARGEAASARRRALALSEKARDSRGSALAAVGSAFVDYLDGSFVDAIVSAERAISLARASGGAEELLLALSVRMFAGAGASWAGEQPDTDHFDLAWAMREKLAALPTESRMLAAHLLAEGALATGRLSQAQEVLDELGDIRSERAPRDEARSPFPAFMIIQRARVLLFRGELTRALPVALAATEEARAQGSAACAALCESFVPLIQANLNERGSARHMIARITKAIPIPHGMLETGAWIVCAYAYFAMGDRAKAAQCVLTAGGGPELDQVQIVDRALGYEILVTDALDRGDVEAASAWGQRSLALAAHPAATVVVEQLLARIDDARGRSDSAAHRAGVSAARSRLTGRYLDAARADLVRARALAAAGLHDVAVEQLAGLAHEADRAGIPGLRRSATHELRLLGRRLPPEAGGGWSSLTERERHIAVLAAEGFSNQVIGSTLFLSARTVQSYMSRILIGLGITSRASLPRHVAELHAAHPRAELPALTPRQTEVALLVADGLSNSEIADRLAISVKTAEKHVGEIMQRWSATSRTSIANLVVAHSLRTAG